MRAPAITGFPALGCWRPTSARCGRRPGGATITAFTSGTRLLGSAHRLLRRHRLWLRIHGPRLLRRLLEQRQGVLQPLRNEREYSVVHNVYNYSVPNNRGNRVSYNGGPGGINARPTPQELAVVHDPRTPPVAAQVQHAREASTNRAQFASASGGQPAALVAARPLATPYKAPAARPPASAMKMAAPQPEAARAPQPEARPVPESRPAAPQARRPQEALPQVAAPRPAAQARPRADTTAPLAPRRCTSAGARPQEARPQPQARPEARSPLVHAASSPGTAGSSAERGLHPQARPHKHRRSRPQLSPSPAAQQKEDDANRDRCRERSRIKLPRPFLRTGVCFRCEVLFCSVYSVVHLLGADYVLRSGDSWARLFQSIPDYRRSRPVAYVLRAAAPDPAHGASARHRRGILEWNATKSMPVFRWINRPPACSASVQRGTVPNLLAVTVQVPFDAPISVSVLRYLRSPERHRACP